MAYTSHFHLPGEYSKPTTASTTLNANMFRPPASPSTSTYNLSKSAGSLLSDRTSVTTNTLLGRNRTEDEHRSLNTPNYFDNDSPMGYSAKGQGRYTLAGQIDTPGGQPPSNGVMEDSLYSDIDYRRRLELGSKRPHDEMETPSHGLAGLGIAGADTTTTPRAAGWTSFAFHTIGGVVGKVWEFCRGGGTGTFRGFQAGGGKPYEPDGQPALTSTFVNETDHFTPDTPVDTQEQETTANPPGAFPCAEMIAPTPDNIPTSHDHDHDHAENIVQNYPEPAQHREPSPDDSLERPAVKRRRTSGNWENDELRRHWVMVEEDEPSPVPLVHRPALQTKRSAPAASRLPTSGRTNLASRLPPPRMYAPSSPLTTPDRRVSSPIPRFGFGSEQKSGIPPPRAPSRLSIGSNSSFAGHIRPPSVVGHVLPPSAAGHVRSPSAAGHIRSPSNAGHIRSPSAAGHIRSPSAAGHIRSPSAAGHVRSSSMVTAETTTYATPRSPQQPETPAYSPTGSRIPQPRGFGPNPFANIRPASPAPRTTPSRPTSRQSIHPPPTTPSFLPKSTPTNGHRRRVSSVSNRKPGMGANAHANTHSNTQSNTQSSPRLDQQAKHLVTKRNASDKKNDTRLDRLNGELQELIRQGQQALGTSFDVEMGEDERWEEE